MIRTPTTRSGSVGAGVPVFSARPPLTGCCLRRAPFVANGASLVAAGDIRCQLKPLDVPQVVGCVARGWSKMLAPGLRTRRIASVSDTSGP
jgi:hypothetical protein